MIDDATLKRLHSQMKRIRTFEEEVLRAFDEHLVPGTTHVCIGQEAIKVGVIDAMAPDDRVLATYRGHGEAVAKGCELTSLFAEIMCRETGLCKGKGGSMHLSDPSVGLVMTNAIVAAHLPIAGGVALSCAIKKTSDVVVCFFGDGAACEGEFFETLNMAAIWRVPLVFVCENNGLAISVPTEKTQATPDIADRARGFGIPATVVDGNDVLAVRDAMDRALAGVRGGDGPTFIECKTVRWTHHSGFAARRTDTEAVEEQWRTVDPIVRYENALDAWGVMSRDEMEQVGLAVKEEIERARAEAEKAPAPGPNTIYEDVFADTTHA
jgi:TPP-dependent pyruvate/acetoin dehydrogenase alpha subunit